MTASKTVNRTKIFTGFREELIITNGYEKKWKKLRENCRVISSRKCGSAAAKRLISLVSPRSSPEGLGYIHAPRYAGHRLPLKLVTAHIPNAKAHKNMAGSRSAQRCAPAIGKQACSPESRDLRPW